MGRQFIFFATNLARITPAHGLTLFYWSVSCVQEPTQQGTEAISVQWCLSLYVFHVGLHIKSTRIAMQQSSRCPRCPLQEHATVCGVSAISIHLIMVLYKTIVYVSFMLFVWNDPKQMYATRVRFFAHLMVYICRGFLRLHESLSEND